MSFLKQVTATEGKRKGASVTECPDDLRVFVGSTKACQRVLNTEFARPVVRQVAAARQRVQECGRPGVEPTVPRLRLLGGAGAERPHSNRSRVPPGNEGTSAAIDVAPVREIYRTGGHQTSGLLVGWRGYFGRVDIPGVLRTLDEWMRHRLRAIQLKQWKRGKTVFRELTARGLSSRVAAIVAAKTRSWWRNSAMGIHIALPKHYFRSLRLQNLQSLAP